MKWMLLLAAGFTILSFPAVAQQPDSAQIAVHYKFSYVYDTTNRDKPYLENMILLVGRRSGVYKTTEGSDQQRVSTNPDGTTRTNTRHTGTRVEYYQFPNEKRVVRKDWIPMNAFIVADAMPAIDWHISKDTATYGSLHCQKATTHFKGRDYTAWFCADLPLHVGPWKLNGLPGVIVEAYDATNEVRFTFDGVSKPDPTIIVPPVNGVKASEKEFSKFEEMSTKDPEAYSKLMAQYNSGNGLNMAVGIKPASKPVINNPIELREKK